MKVLVDCDPGIDDTAALLALAGLHHRGDISLIGVSTVGGNVPVAQSTRVASLVLALAHLEQDVPLYQGYDSPTLPPPPGFHGADGVGNCYFEHVRAKPPTHFEPDDVIALIDAHADDLTVLCIGPLTNAAIWAERLVAEHKRQPRRWVVMGGAFRDHPGNVAPGVEFNIWADIHAAHQFFATATAVDVVPLNITEQPAFTRHDIGRLRRACPWLAAVLDDSLRTHTQRRGLDYFWLHDLVAVGAVVEPARFTFEQGVVAVSVADVAGATAFTPGDGGHRVAASVLPSLRDRVFRRLRDGIDVCLAIDSPRSARAAG